MSTKQTISKSQKYTFEDFNRDFPNDASCLERIMQQRYPAGIHCDKCGRVTKHHQLKSRPVYCCDLCGHQVSPMVGTIFEKSSTSLRIWFHAIYLMSATRCGISAKQIQRETGVTYKTAFRMFNKIRSLLDESGCDPLPGEVEVDESYFGGMRPGKRGRGAANKTVVVGAVERKGRIIARKAPNVKAETLVPFVEEYVLPSTMVYTDELQSYNALGRKGYSHRRIHHTSKIYVDGDVHTNTIEGFWSLVKRGIGGVYHAVSEKYLQDYLNEYSFRYNHRNDEQPMFETFLQQI